MLPMLPDGMIEMDLLSASMIWWSHRVQMSGSGEDLYNVARTWILYHGLSMGASESRVQAHT